MTITVNHSFSIDPLNAPESTEASDAPYAISEPTETENEATEEVTEPSTEENASQEVSTEPSAEEETASANPADATTSTETVTFADRDRDRDDDDDDDRDDDDCDEVDDVAAGTQAEGPESIAEIPAEKTPAEEIPAETPAEVPAEETPVEETPTDTSYPVTDATEDAITFGSFSGVYTDAYGTGFYSYDSFYLPGTSSTSSDGTTTSTAGLVITHAFSVTVVGDTSTSFTEVAA